MDTTHFGAALATPGPNTHEVFALLAPHYAKATLRRVFDALPLEQREQQAALYAQATSFIDQIHDGPQLFRPEIGRAALLAGPDHQDPVQGWIQLLLTLHEVGFQAEWRLDNLQPCLHLVAGIGVVVKKTLKVTADRDSVALTTAGDTGPRDCLFERQANGLTALDRVAPDQITCADKTITLVSAGPATHLWYGPHQVPYQGDRASAQAALAQACALLTAAAPAYAVWVGRALTRLALIEGIAGTCDYSHSLPRYLGLVYLSQPRGLIHNIEGLVHECAHQHYHLALLVDPLQNGADQTLYPSPLKAVGRPIERILISYHALGNICLALDGLLAHKLATKDADLCRRRIQSNAAMARQLAQHLEQSSGLTATGQALWRTLAAALSAADLDAVAGGV